MPGADSASIPEVGLFEAHSGAVQREPVEVCLLGFRLKSLFGNLAPISESGKLTSGAPGLMAGFSAGGRLAGATAADVFWNSRRELQRRAVSA